MENERVAELLTVKLSDLCRGPRCNLLVMGKASYCSQDCRNNAHALRRVARLLSGVENPQVIKILQAWRLSRIEEQTK